MRRASAWQLTQDTERGTSMEDGLSQGQTDARWRLQVYIAKAKQQERPGSTAFGSVFDRKQRPHWTRERGDLRPITALHFELQDTMEVVLLHNKEAKVRHLQLFQGAGRQLCTAIL